MKRLLVAALLVSAPAFAALPPVSASIGYASEVFSTRGYDLVDGDDHLPMWRFGAAYSLRPARGILDVELQFHTGVTADNAYQSLQSALWLRGVEGGATWRYPLYRHLEPYGRLGAGYDWATLTLGGEQRLRQTVGRPAANAMAGVQVPMPLRLEPEHTTAIVLDFGIGYTLRASYGFNAMQPAPPDKAPEDPIARQPTNLGSLSLSGISYRVLLSFRL